MVALLGPAVHVVLVSGLFFGICSFFGRGSGCRSFVSVTVLAFVPTPLYHLAQSLVLLSAIPQEMPLLQSGRLSLARVLDPQ